MGLCHLDSLNSDISSTVANCHPVSFLPFFIMCQFYSADFEHNKELKKISSWGRPEALSMAYIFTSIS